MSPMPDPGSVASTQPGDAGFRPPAARPSMPSGATEQPFFRLDLKRSLHLHRRLAVGIVLAGLALAGVSFVLKWPTYLAQSQVFIQPAAPQMMAPGGRANWPNDTNSYDTVIQQQMQAVSHPTVLLAALRKLEPSAFRRTGEDERAAAARLGKAIEAKRLTTSYQIEISAHAKDPELAAKMANAMAMSLVENASRQEKSGDSERLAVLTAEQTQIQKELAADRAEQEMLNAQLGTASIGPSATNHYDQDIASIREELVKARAARDESAARLSTMEAVKGATPQALNAEADEMAATDAGLVSMKMSLNQRRAVLIAQMANLSPSHPLYKQDAAELAQIDSSLEAMMKDLRAKVSSRIEQRLHTDLDRTTAVQDRLNGQLSQLAAAAAGATPQLQRAADLATNIARLQSRYTVVDEQVRDLTLQTNAPGSAYLSALASAPTHPAWALILKSPLLLALGGILVGLAAALVANNLDPTIYIASDVTRVLGIAPMAQLPDFTEVSPGVAEDHLLRLSSAIDHASRQGNLKSCIFTAVGPGGGATTIATRVQAILQAMGRDSVLVDARGVLVKSVPPSGSGKSTSTALMIAERGSLSTTLTQQSAQEGGGDESLILTDTAPLAISAETEYLARHVDAAIVVIESGVTTRMQLLQASETLQRLNVAAVGFVLNKVGIAIADAPFLDTVQAMEQHQGGQSRSLFRPLAVENRNTEIPREDRSLQQHPTRKLAGGEPAATGWDESAETSRPPAAKRVGAMSAGEGQSLKKDSTRKLPAEAPPADASVGSFVASAAPFTAETESTVDSKLDRSVLGRSIPAGASVRPAATPEKAENPSLKQNPSQEFAKGQPAWTKQPQPRYFEPSPVPPVVEAKNASPVLTIAESPLPPLERHEMEASRLNTPASQAGSQAPMPREPVTPVPVQTVFPNPTQPPPASAQPASARPVSAQPTSAHKAPEPTRQPVSLPVGRPVQENAPDSIRIQGQARIEEWVNLGVRANNVREEALLVETTPEAGFRETNPAEAAPLSGLRDRSLTQALRDLHRLARPELETFAEESVEQTKRQRDAAPAHAASPSQREPLRTDASIPPGASHISVPTPEPTRAATASAVVTASPEFLPPGSDGPASAKESKTSSKIDRRDRRETFDDVEVLPSWRGQYKKR